jgi:hypothetical protein
MAAAREERQVVFGEGEGEEEAVQRRQQIRALFDEFDRDKRGRLTLSQFEQGLKREGLWHRIRDDVRPCPDNYLLSPIIIYFILFQKTKQIILFLYLLI